MHILSFNPEVILYFYMASCILVLGFNIAYIVLNKVQRRQQQKQRLDMKDDMLRQMELVKSSKPVEEEHLEKLRRQLVRLKRLKVFEQSLADVWKEKPEELCLAYIKALRGVFLELIHAYSKRDEIEKAYVCRLIEQFSINRNQKYVDGIMEFLLQMVVERDAFLRENALKALYSMGNKEVILSAWIKLYENNIHHNEKLLADGLLKFSGDKRELAGLLWDYRKEYNSYMMFPVMQFIRYLTGDFQGEFLKLLDNQTTDKELRLEAIRYLRRYPYGPARKILQNFVWYQEYIDWEYAAMAAAALSGYPGEDTISCLKSGLHAENWYVRYNSAQALINDLKISQIQLFDIYNGKDRYAREILLYTWEKAGISSQVMELEAEYV